MNATGSTRAGERVAVGYGRQPSFRFLIEKVSARFYVGFAEKPTVRTLRRQKEQAQQLGLALGIDEADSLVFRFAIETGPTGRFAWQVNLVMPAQLDKSSVQLRLVEDDGY
jgi:hypothetical protein